MSNEPINPAPAPVPEPTPTPTPTPAPEPVAPVAEPTPVAPAAPATEPAPAPNPLVNESLQGYQAPVATPTATPGADKPKNNKLAAIITICSLVGVAIIAGVIVLIINLNKPKEPTAKDVLNNLFNMTEGDNGDYNLNDLFGDDDDYDYDSYDDDDYDYGNYDYRTDQEKANSKKTLEKCSDAADCMKKLEIEAGYTYEQYVDAIGMKGELDTNAYNSDYSKTYIWTFSNGDTIKAEFSDSSSIYLDAEYVKSKHTDSEVDLDGYDEVEDQIEDGTVTYKQLKKALGNVDGLITKRSLYYGDTNENVDYLWVSSNSDKYISASVNEDGIVTFVSGRK